MDERLIVTASPHIRDKATTQGLMGDVLISLLPCVVAATLIFGFRALMVIVVTTAACVAFEYLYCRLLHKKIPISDLSACVTGVILGMNMPANMPFWICIVGAFVAIVITKQLFGGLGYNFANPALVGRIVLFLGFAGRMTAYVYPKGTADAISSATVLAETVDKSSVSLVDMVFVRALPFTALGRPPLCLVSCSVIRLLLSVTNGAAFLGLQSGLAVFRMVWSPLVA